MDFPETRISFVERLAKYGNDADWRAFLLEYWLPVHRFARSRGASAADADEVTAETFEVLWENRLLFRWTSSPVARLRTLLCSVVRKILANRFRQDARRRVIQNEKRLVLDATLSQADTDIFYAAWADGLVRHAVESLAASYYAEDKGDYVRVLFGRACEGLTIKETASLLDLTPSNVDYFYRHATHRLSQRLRERLRRHVEAYCGERADDEIEAEWTRLRDHLARHGGLEQTLRAVAKQHDFRMERRSFQARLSQAADRLSTRMRTGESASPGGSSSSD